MKKNALGLLLVVLSFALLPFSCAGADGPTDTRNDATFALPSSLEKIENEAFVGVAVRTVIFQDGLNSIGDYAFADAQGLTNVYIPASTEYIGENAFPSSKRLTIHGVVRSYAAKWAKEHEIPFVPSAIWYLLDHINSAGHTYGTFADGFYQRVFDEKINHLHGRTEDEGKSMRPQERPELNPIDYNFP